MTHLPRNLLILAVTVMLLSLAGGCGGATPTKAAPVKRVVIPSQEPLSYDEYPEWAKKAWVHLVIPDIVLAGGRRGDFQSYLGRGLHYYVDPASFDPESKSYVTIENEIIHLGASIYKITDIKVQGQFEGNSEGRGWIFPCSQSGKWHSGMGGVLGSSGTIDADDFSKCGHCDRYREVGRIEFQVETGNVQWSRY